MHEWFGKSWVGAPHGFVDHRVTFHPTTVGGQACADRLWDAVGPELAGLSYRTQSVQFNQISCRFAASTTRGKKRVAHYLPQSLVLLSLPLSLTTTHCWQSMSRQTMDEVKIGCDKSRGLSFFAELVSEHNQNGKISMERETFVLIFTHLTVNLNELKGQFVGTLWVNIDLTCNFVNVRSTFAA